MDAFRKFNFDGDDRWKAYLKTVELPTGDTETTMLRVKARWYKRNIDPNFDTTAVSGAAKPQQSGASFKPGSEAPGAGSGSSRSYSQAPPPPPPPPRYGQAGQGGGGTYGGSNSQRRLFVMHLGILLLGAFVLVPFLPYTRTAYTYLMRLAIVAHGYKIYLQYGMPSFRPFSMLMAWIQRVMPTTDFMQLLVAFSFSAQPPMVLVAAPFMVLAAYHATAYAAAHWAGSPLWQRYGSRVHAVMLRRQQDALLLNAACEIGTALLLLVQLLTPARSLLTLLFYTQILKLKLHVPDSAAQHRQVWRKIDEVTLPYRRQVPVIERFIQLAANWFTSVPGAR